MKPKQTKTEYYKAPGRMITIDKALNNFAFICRKYYIFKLLAGVSPDEYRYLTSAY